MNLAKIGATLFALWGLLHVIGGAAIILATRQSPAQGFAFYDPAATNYTTLAGDVLAYLAFGFAWVGILVTVVAVRYNWRNNRHGLMLNTVLVGLTDLGLILFLLWPGHLSWIEASPGLLLFVGATVISGIARQTAFEPAGQGS